MIRVLHVVTHMNRGGLETMIMNYYRNIDRNKVQFDFLVHRYQRADYDDEIEKLGGVIYRIPMLNPFSHQYLAALDSFFNKHNEYKIVHSHLDCLSSIPLKAAKKAGVPFCIAHSHTTNQDYNLKYLIKMFYRGKAFDYADKLFACSDEAGKWMFGEHEYEVLPNAIDAKKFAYSENASAKIRTEFGIDISDYVVGHVGRFNYPKNHDFLIEIFQSIKKKCESAKLLLVGVGDKEDTIKEKVKRYNLDDSVIFTGLRGDIPNLLSAMDIFVFPSLYEGLPVTLVEAQASGLPCFISDKVPIECKKTSLVTQLSLEQSADVWADEILSIDSTERLDTYEEICKAGFDIKRNAEQLQYFYENVFVSI